MLSSTPRTRRFLRAVGGLCTRQEKSLVVWELAHAPRPGVLQTSTKTILYAFPFILWAHSNVLEVLLDIPYSTSSAD